MEEESLAIIKQLAPNLTSAELRELTCLFCVYDLEHGEEIITEGKSSDAMFIVESGSVSVLVGKGQKQVEVVKLGPGGVVGEVSLLDPGPASATARVFVKARVFEFTHQSLLTFCGSSPTAAIQLLEALAKNLAVRLHKTSDAMIARDEWKLKLTDGKLQDSGLFANALTNTTPSEQA